MYKKILLPTDGSKFANNAANHGLYLAEKSGAEIIVLSVIENSFVNSIPLGEDTMDIENLLKEDCEKNLESFKELSKTSNNLNISYLIKQGSPAKVILEVADTENVDLIIVGSSGKSNFDKFLMGSVADKLVKSAHCPVLVTR